MKTEIIDMVSKSEILKELRAYRDDNENYDGDPVGDNVISDIISLLNNMQSVPVELVFM